MKGWMDNTAAEDHFSEPMITQSSPWTYKLDGIDSILNLMKCYENAVHADSEPESWVGSG